MCFSFATFYSSPLLPQVLMAGSMSVVFYEGYNKSYFPNFASLSHMAEIDVNTTLFAMLLNISLLQEGKIDGCDKSCKSCKNFASSDCLDCGILLNLSTTTGTCQNYTCHENCRGGCFGPTPSHCFGCAYNLNPDMEYACPDKSPNSTEPTKNETNNSTIPDPGDISQIKPEDFLNMTSNLIEKATSFLYSPLLNGTEAQINNTTLVTLTNFYAQFSRFLENDTSAQQFFLYDKVKMHSASLILLCASQKFKKPILDQFKDKCVNFLLNLNYTLLDNESNSDLISNISWAILEAAQSSNIYAANRSFFSKRFMLNRAAYIKSKRRVFNSSIGVTSLLDIPTLTSSVIITPYSLLIRKVNASNSTDHSFTYQNIKSTTSGDIHVVEFSFLHNNTTMGFDHILAWAEVKPEWNIYPVLPNNMTIYSDSILQIETYHNDSLEKFNTTNKNFSFDVWFHLNYSLSQDRVGKCMRLDYDPLSSATPAWVSLGNIQFDPKFPDNRTVKCSPNAFSFYAVAVEGGITPPKPPTEEESSGLGTFIIALVIAGVIIIIGVLVFYFYRRKQLANTPLQDADFSKGPKIELKNV